MDSLRSNLSRTTVSLKASNFRLAAATTALATCQQAFASALADLKAGTCADAKQRANEAAAATKAAQAKLNAAQAEVEAREAEAEKATAKYNSNNSSRPRRDPKYTFKVNPMTHEFYPTTAPGQGEAATQPLDDVTIGVYISTSKTALADVSALKAFPAPPAALCAKPSCLQTQKERALAACPCNLRAVFAGLNGKDFRQAKLNYHPDRFAQAPTAIRADCQASAKEITAVLDAMSQSSRSDSKKRGQDKQPGFQIRKKGNE
ncbi:hypothetical protein LTR36_010957 [Oleoguttula mirabilis]|uniref:Uncharacterized protein n=1 Tax=Oleoguttula mirabilis TaxID=1507867 RepID=A0AAV9J3G8_9PEZI|nr:hypothetical protein LTR36_010957 [Oleoguttula mirabilis]